MTNDRWRRMWCIVLMGMALAGCASRSEMRASAAPAVTYEVAEPLELEPRSYAESQRNKYNRIYARPESERPAPSAFLVACLQRIAAQRERERAEYPERINDRVLTALDPGMGDGRNTIALAQAGYHTIGVDPADVGVNRARKRAAELGLEIDARVGYYTDDYRQPDSWDVLASMYFGFNPYLEQAEREQIKNSVKPGGYIIYESAGGRKNDVIACFLDWEIIVYEKDWGEPHWAAQQPMPGPGLITRILARRPQNP